MVEAIWAEGGACTVLARRTPGVTDMAPFVGLRATGATMHSNRSALGLSDTGTRARAAHRPNAR